MLKIQAQSKIPTDYGVFTVYAFSENEEDGVLIWFGWQKIQILVQP
jgi:hypothetical protein